MDRYEEQEERIFKVFDEDEIPSVELKSLEVYLIFLRDNIEMPCELTGIEDFNWEEFYIIGPGDKKEYEKLKKNRPSYSDKYDLLSFGEFDEDYGIFVNLKRISDDKIFSLPLADLKSTEKKSKNYQILDDYSVWFVNNM